MLARLLFNFFLHHVNGNDFPNGTFRKLWPTFPPPSEDVAREEAKWRARVNGSGEYSSEQQVLNLHNIWNRGFWTSAPLPLSIGLLAEHSPTRECQQNKLYKTRILNVGDAALSPEPCPQKVRETFDETRLRRVESLRAIYLQGERWALFFPLWERRRNFQTPSSEQSTPPELYSGSREAFPADWVMSCNNTFA